MITVHTDGGARGNPGPAAAAAIIEIDGQRIELSHFLGRATNNQAEYQAVILALNWLVDHQQKGPIKLLVDSELIAKQLNGQYRVKHPELKPLYLEAKELIELVGQVAIRSILREQNEQADHLVNQTLDAASEG